MISSLTVPIGQKHIHYIHLIHYLVGKPSGKERPSPAIPGQWPVGFLNRHGVQELASGARAGQYRLVDLTFTHLGQLADVAAGLCNIIRRHGLCRITGELVEAVEYRA
jgi:hypothetical protein